MLIKTYLIDQATGEQYHESDCDLADALDPESEDYAEALAELQASGRAWVGGGAAPMFLLMRMESPQLILERREQPDLSPVGPGFIMTPPIDETYWSYRVKLTDTQAIIGFPKFGTIGIGFAQEDDWNTNLPYTSTAESIYSHIRHNNGDGAISDQSCLAAIALVQSAVREDKGE